MDIRHAVEMVGLAVDAVGVAVIVFAIGIAGVAFARGVNRDVPFDASYRALRQSIGRGILLGLELLVAGDIIRTVAIAPTLHQRRGAGRHRRHPHLPQLQPRGGAHRALAVAGALRPATPGPRRSSNVLHPGRLQGDRELVRRPRG